MALNQSVNIRVEMTVSIDQPPNVAVNQLEILRINAEFHRNQHKSELRPHNPRVSEHRAVSELFRPVFPAFPRHSREAGRISKADSSL